MTTRIHIVNFGPDPVDVETIVPESGEVTNAMKHRVYVQQSTDIYLHGTQAVKVTEHKEKQ